jgi:hypothetical protein
VTESPRHESTGVGRESDTPEAEKSDPAAVSERLPDIAGLNIVLVGDFNPAILQPAWLAANDLLRWEEADSANIQIVSRDVTIFSTDWVELAATPDRFQVTSAAAPSYKLVRDLIIGVFRLLPHTPIRALGINRNYHFRVPDQKTWDAFGDKIAPKDLWQDVLVDPGTRSLIMLGKRPDEYAGNFVVQVEPSLRFQGIYIATNDHFQLDAMEVATAEGMADILGSEWEASEERANNTTTRLLSAL